AITGRATVSHNGMRQALHIDPPVPLTPPQYVGGQTVDSEESKYLLEAEYYREWSVVKLKVFERFFSTANELFTDMKGENDSPEYQSPNNLRLRSYSNELGSELRTEAGRFKFVLSGSVWQGSFSNAHPSGMRLSALYNGRVRYTF